MKKKANQKDQEATLRNTALSIPLEFDKAVEGLVNVRIKKVPKPPKP